MISKKVELSKLADIEYHGSEGVTQYCLDAIVRLIQFGDRIEKARLLSAPADQWNCRSHAFIFTINNGQSVVIGSGFSSGYRGEGPLGLTKALQVLIRYEADIDEYEINQDILERVNHRCLLSSDIDFLDSSGPVRPNRFYDYILWDNEEAGKEKLGDREISLLFPPIIPIAIIDTRILDLALKLEEHPDVSLLSGYRRLEGLVRNKADDLKGMSGAKLFAKALHGDSSLLHWPDLDKSESEGRASIFIGIYKAYRNKRAHHEQDYDAASAVREFLLLNEIFLLEFSLITRPRDIE